MTREPPAYNPSEVQIWSKIDRCSVAKCEHCGVLGSSHTDEHWVFQLARDHCQNNRHAVTVHGTTSITVRPPEAATK